MASDRFVLTRPIEVTSATDGFRVDYNGAGWSALTLTNGVYGCIATYLYELQTKLKTVDAGFSVSLTTDFYTKIEHSSNTFEIEWTEATTGQVAGFDAACTPVATSFTATQIPRYCWLPARVRADQGTWSPNHKQNFSGKRSQAGIVAGLSTGKVLYSTTLTMNREYDYNLQWSRGRTVADQVRCLDHFVDGSRSDYPSSGNVPTGGFYFWPDYTACQPYATMDAGDASLFNYTVSPDTYAFCEFDPEFNVGVSPGLQVGHEYYNVEIPISTSEYPSGGWSAP